MNQITEPDVHDMMRELTRQHSHRQPYEWQPVEGGTRYGRSHVTDVPALVDQLVSASPAGSGEMSGAKPGSRPAARIESLDTLMLIDDEAGSWIHRLGGDVPGTDSRNQRTVAGPVGTKLRLGRLHGLHPATKVCDLPVHRKHKAEGWCCLRGNLEHDVRRWWHQARIVTGWDSAAWRPRNTCPICDVQGGLRIKLELQTATCIECRSVWDTASIGLLADHIRAENAEDDESAEERNQTCA